MKPLNLKDIAIIDSFPVYKYGKVILSVGCGPGRIDFHLASMGCRVYATDAERHEVWKEIGNLTFHESNIFDLTSFPIKKAPVVICSEVLEHIEDYKTALSNLLSLTVIRLIITVPHRNSFDHPTHCHYWDDEATVKYKDIKEFNELCNPYRTTISKILTKERDRGKQYAYLIIVDKRQKIK